MSIYIYSIGKDTATVEIGELWFALTLDNECERVHDDDYEREYSYLQYTPIILDIQGMDENDKPYPISDEMAEKVKKELDCDKFYNAYQSLFDNELKWGKSVAGWY
ncbi:hypothetical protein [Moraxella sp. ZY200743]|uniref:hypothetical protein n=1 Tax=Moraxella sp. ZY200743 TaxID=2911970 RepID=UPI003D7EA6B3